MVNRLAGATSPYLLQHADNPVDWWEWGADALSEAGARNRPILLSVGYAACHWCHVMAHESFEDAETAALINESFVPIKVDREERPDIDAVYMQATQAMTGQGGWPMTVFLTPDGAPFYAGTYFPPRPGHGLPSFRQVLEAVGEAWNVRRDEVRSSAEQIATQLRATAAGLTGPAREPVTSTDLDAALATLAREFDLVDAGFGRAPKFPPSLVLEALLRCPPGDAEDAEDAGEAGDVGGGPGAPDARAMARRTLSAMAAGGLYDQLGGGFARYSVDRTWTVPHFEKMLYDNALLLGCYTHAWRLDPQAPEAPRYATVVAETIDWLTRELRTGDGGFAASLDADSADVDGHAREGAFYVWTPADLAAVLGPDDGRRAAEHYGVTAAGNFEHGASTLTRRVPDPDWDAEPAVRHRLFEARSARPAPARDDKVVTAWNGWLITALVEAGQVFDRPDWLELARSAGESVWSVHWVDGRLRRTSRDGVVGSAAGIAEDYAALIGAFVRLAEAGGPEPWIPRAEQLAGVLAEVFAADDGGLFDTAADADPLYARPRDPTDNATPSGLSATVTALGRLSAYTGDQQWAQRAERAAASGAELVRQAPRFAGWLLADAVSRLRRPPVQVAICAEPCAEPCAESCAEPGGTGEPTAAELTRLAWRLAPAGSVVVTGPPDAANVPLLAQRTMLDGRPTAYVCRDFVCRLPVTDPAALRAQLGG